MESANEDATSTWRCDISQVVVYCSNLLWILINDSIKSRSWTPACQRCPETFRPQQPPEAKDGCGLFVGWTSCFKMLTCHFQENAQKIHIHAKIAWELSWQWDWRDPKGHNSQSHYDYEDEIKNSCKKKMYLQYSLICFNHPDTKKIKVNTINHREDKTQDLELSLLVQSLIWSSPSTFSRLRPCDEGNLDEVLLYGKVLPKENGHAKCNDHKPLGTNRSKQLILGSLSPSTDFPSFIRGRCSSPAWPLMTMNLNNKALPERWSYNIWKLNSTIVYLNDDLYLHT